ncbi:permease [Vallitalea okinawensis]|uniref:permease n=1 Tax=Vallitalea okinawensis TaxID=2078660 RepID=UPI000CFD4B57|nr:permease [Vallitalea okinawensis]
MDISSLIMYVLAIILLIISFIKDRSKTKKAIKKGWMAFKKIVPVLVPLFLIVGIVLTVVTPDMIGSLLGEQSGFIGVLIGLVTGSIAFMPPFVTYPLGVELLDKGAGYPQVAALVTTLMAVGLVYWSAETKFFGTKSTILRNGLAFIASITVALVIWGVM